MPKNNGATRKNARRQKAANMMNRRANDLYDEGHITSQERDAMVKEASRIRAIPKKQKTA